MAEWREPEERTKDEVRALRLCLASQVLVKTCGFYSKWDEKSLEGFQQRSDVVWHVKRTLMAVELKRGFGDFEVETGKSIGDAHSNPGGEMVVKAGRQWKRWLKKWSNSGYNKVESTIFADRFDEGVKKSEWWYQIFWVWVMRRVGHWSNDVGQATEVRRQK